MSSSLLGSIIARSRNWVNDPWARRHHEGGFLVKECKWVKICEILTQRILQEFLLLFSTPQTLFYKFLTPLWSKSSKSHNFYAHICWHDPMHNGHRGAIFEKKNQNTSPKTEYVLLSSKITFFAFIDSALNFVQQYQSCGTTSPSILLLVLDRLLPCFVVSRSIVEPLWMVEWRTRQGENGKMYAYSWLMRYLIWVIMISRN